VLRALYTAQAVNKKVPTLANERGRDVLTNLLSRGPQSYDSSLRCRTDVDAHLCASIAKVNTA
jgi:hypothetical protein